MQLSLTRTKSTALTAIQYASEGARVAGVILATIAAATIEFGPGIAEQACIRTIATGIIARRFYGAHLSRHVESAFYGICFWAFLAIALISSVAFCAYRLAEPIVQKQWAIQVADFREFNRAVRGDRPAKLRGRSR